LSYTVIARKWRPQKFTDLIGQQHVAKTLINAIENDRIAHGYIFTGPRGVGKTTSARLFAKAVNCENTTNGEPCNSCVSCTSITNGTSMDVIEIDGASNNSVDNVRDLRENVKFTPTQGRFKIYIIDEVHMLSKGAFNALLKTLEEPPKHVIFIFATTEIHKVLPTILSRCQRFDFKRISTNLIIERLEYICEQESINAEKDALFQIAKKADGGMRDSQSLLDQILSFSGSTITLENVNSSLGIVQLDRFFELVNFFHQKKTGNAITLINNVFNEGYDLSLFLSGLEEHFRQLLLCLTVENTELLESTEDDKQKYFEQSKLFTQKDILRIVNILQETEKLIKSGLYPKLKLELAVAKICQMDKSIELKYLLEKFSSEKKNSNLDSQKKKVEIPKAPEKKTPVFSPQAPTIQQKNISLSTVQSFWEKQLNSYKINKPHLAALMVQAHLFKFSNKQLIVAFHQSEDGKKLAFTFKNSLRFLENEFKNELNQQISIKIEFINFDEHKIEINYQDNATILKNICEKDPMAKKIIDTFGLKLAERN
jgi:DNA polymerase-3 subunit gamma/tau